MEVSGLDQLKFAFELTECDRSGEIDVSAWAAGVAGRRLCTPKADPARVSLSEWLTKSSKSKEAQKIPRYGRADMPKKWGWSKVKASIGQSKFNAVAPGETPAAATNRKHLDDVENPFRKNLSPAEAKNAPLRPISQELQKRRNLHPRLRWPRLQRHVTDARPKKLPPLFDSADFDSQDDSDTDVSSHVVPSSTGITRSGYDKLLDDHKDSVDVQYYLRDALEKIQNEEDIFIGPDSVFYAGDQTTMWPPWGVSDASDVMDSFEARSQSKHHSHRLHGVDSAHVSTSNLSCSSSSSILPRSKPHEGPISGSTSTIHTISARTNEFSEYLPGLLSPPSTSTLSHSASVRRGGRYGGFVIARSDEGGYKRVGKRGEHLQNLHVDDEKWISRQAPVSLLMARNARGASRGAGGEVTPQSSESNTVLDFESWGLDDAYLRSLLKSSTTADLRRIQRLNLANNRLTAKSIECLAKSGTALSALRSFNLEKNLLGEHGCLEVVKFFEAVAPRLTDLMLAGNSIGDRACEELCQSIRVWCHELRVLSLAQNDLGLSDRAGIALGTLTSELHELEVIDLHWNAFHGVGARAFFQGVYDNAVSLHGKLCRLDISWNRIGVQCANSQCNVGLESSCSCSCCSTTRRAIQMLASVFQDNKVLFHMDLSYNGLSAANCRILADGLRANHTLFGLHLMGNHATVDDLGFVVPNESVAFEDLSARLENELDINRYVRGVPHRLEAQNNQVAELNPLTGKSPCQTSWGCTSRNVEKCWICENWYKQDVSYTPGFSGVEESADDITSVAAFFSIDGFDKPTLLGRVEEAYNRRNFDGRMTAKVRKRLFETQEDGSQKYGSERRGATIKDMVPRLPNGKVVRFVGSRVLPPCKEPVEVVFLINGKTFVTADDLHERTPPSPKLLFHFLQKLIQSGSFPASATRSSVLPMTLTEVNVLSVAMTALEGFEQSGCGLCILEDPAKRGEISVYPRRALHEKPQVQHKEWTFESSCFKDFLRDADDISGQCFDADLSLSKVLQIIKDRVHQDKFISYMRPLYKQVVAGYHYVAFSFFDQTSPGVSLSMFALRDTMFKCEQKVVARDKCKSWLFDKKSLLNQDIDTSFVVANVYNAAGDRPKLKALPEKGLCRFQFFEALVRMVCRRFVESGEKSDASLAMQEFLDISKFGEEALELRRSLHKCLFTEEADLVIQEYAGMLDALYDSYKFKACNAGSHGKFCYGSWLELLHDADATAEAGLTQASLSYAFALGKELRVDEAATYRHMELSRAEFVACLGAVIRLREDFEPDFFGDMLAYFISMTLSVPFNMLASGGMDGMASMVNFASDPVLSQVVQLVSRLFLDADEDGSGTLSVREFRRCLGQAKVVEEIRQTGIEITDFNVLFKQMDHDGSGEVTLHEFCEALFKLKVAVRGSSRAIAYFRRVFAENDKDGSGTLDLQEFRNLCSDAAVQKKMLSFDVSIDDIETLFEDMVADITARSVDGKGAKEVSADHMVAAFLRMRDPCLGGKRATNFLRQVFLEADADRSGSLSKEEYKQTFLSDRVTQRINKLGVSVPDWLNIFDALDLDGDGELSQDELLQGVSTIWEAELQESLRREVSKASKKATAGAMKRSATKDSLSATKDSFLPAKSLTNASLGHEDQAPITRSVTAR